MNRNPLAKGDILIVDDYPDNLELLFTILKEEGYDVRRVLNGKQALMAVEAEPPDLILLDIRMPEMDGYQVCQSLKSQSKTADIPIIFLSALDDISDKIKGFDIGGVDYITKPFNIAEVLSRVETQLTLQKQKELLQQEIFKRQKAEEELKRIIEKLLQEVEARKKAEDRLTILNKRLKELATLDGLTQIANRYQFDEHLEQEWNRLQREKLPLALIMADIDYFKLYNDTYKHLAGDECLKIVAKTIKNSVRRPGDLAARYGGEEFSVILPNTDLNGAVEVAEKIRHQIHELYLLHPRSKASQYVTLSLGVASLIPNSHFSGKDLIDRADNALYNAKIQGRDRICVFSELP